MYYVEVYPAGRYDGHWGCLKTQPYGPSSLNLKIKAFSYVGRKQLGADLARQRQDLQCHAGTETVPIVESFMHSNGLQHGDRAEPGSRWAAMPCMRSFMATQCKTTATSRSD